MAVPFKIKPMDQHIAEQEHIERQHDAAERAEPDEPETDDGRMVLEFSLPRWLQEQNRIASRVMKGCVVQRRDKAIQVDMWAVIRKAERCLRCGREITHPASKLVGYGMDCVMYTARAFDWLHAAETLTPQQIREIKDRSKVDTMIRGMWMPLSAILINGHRGDSLEARAILDRCAAKLPPPRPCKIYTDTKEWRGQRNALLFVECDPKYKDDCRALRDQFRGSHWDAERKAWAYPLSRDSVEAVMAVFGQIASHVSDQVTAIMRSNEIERSAQSLKSMERSPAIPNERTNSWEHQRRAYWFANELPAVMLNMDMGTGKSKVAAHLIANSPGNMHIILAPKAVVRGVWPKQFDVHLPDEIRQTIDVIPLTKGTADFKKRQAEVAVSLARKAGHKVVFIVSYQSAWREPLAAWILKQKWDTATLDESHKIKAPKGVASVFCGRLGRVARKRIALTGTIMPHSPMDAWAQYRFLDPGIFGSSFTAYKHEYAVVENRGTFEMIVGYQNRDKLNRKIFSIAYRVTKAEALDLPEEMFVDRVFNLEPAAMRVYKSMESTLVALVDEGGISASNVLVKLLRLAQMVGGWAELDNGSVQRVSHAKQQELEDVLDDFDQREPLVVFYRFTPESDIIRAVCESQGRTYCELSGRMNQMADWQDGKYDVIGVQIQAGGVGVDLTRAAYDIEFSVGFSMGDFDQAMARTHRPGQTRPVTHIRLIADHTVDVKIYQSMMAKRVAVKSVLEGESEKIDPFKLVRELASGDGEVEENEDD